MVIDLQYRNENSVLSHEYEVVRNLHDKKQEEFSASMLKVSNCHDLESVAVALT